VSAADLARRLQLVPRYVHEWCRQQASARLICCDAAAETFWMTPVQQDILSSSKEHGQGASPHFAAGGFQSLAAFAQVAAEDLPELFRTGGGLTYDSYDQSVTCGVCRELVRKPSTLYRARAHPFQCPPLCARFGPLVLAPPQGVWVRHALLDRLCSLPGARPLLEGGCRVADVGCGCGEAALAVAAAFPRTTVRGFDTSAKALAVARAAAAARGVRNAEFFDPGEEERGMGEGVFDLVMTHDAIHDCARPAAVLASVRRAMKPGARWVLGDMGALESHAANVASHPLAPLLYGFSCHLCLPSAMVGENPAGLGTLGLSQVFPPPSLLSRVPPRSLRPAADEAVFAACSPALCSPWWSACCARRGSAGWRCWIGATRSTATTWSPPDLSPADHHAPRRDLYRC
jgi:SAM-dependent methyltransferase